MAAAVGSHLQQEEEEGRQSPEVIPFSSARLNWLVKTDVGSFVLIG